MKVTLPTLVVTLLLLEVVFRWIIPACERPDTFWDEEYQIVKYVPGAGEGLYTIGLTAGQQGKWRINNAGWNSAIDYQREKSKPRIAIIGDSYVEGFQVDVEKQFVQLLRDSVAGRKEVYSFGRAGAPLPQYLHMSRYVNREFNPDFLIFNLVHNDFDRGITALNPYDTYFMTLDIGEEVTETAPLPYPEIGWKQWFKVSALMRYVYYNARIGLVLRAQKEKNSNAEAYTQELVFDHWEEVERMAEYCVATIKKENPGKRILFVMDGDRPNMYLHPPAECPNLRLNALMQELTEKYKCEFLDLSPMMVKDYEKNGRPFNSELDLHWDEYGHELVGKAIFDHLVNPPLYPWYSSRY